MATSSCLAKGRVAFQGSSSRTLAPRSSSGLRPAWGRKSSTTTHALLDFVKSFGAPKAPPPPPPKPVRPTITLEPSYNLQAALLSIAALEGYQGWWPIAGFTGLLGVFLTIQASRVKFIFDDEALEIKINGKDSDNVVVGGQNRWPYESFINWELWFPAFPVLVYFKENQTKPEGQIHFFPIIFNGKQLYDVMVERCGPSATSGPK